MKKTNVNFYKRIKFEFIYLDNILSELDASIINRHFNLSHGSFFCMEGA